MNDGSDEDQKPRATTDSLDLAELRQHPGLRKVYREPAIGLWGWICLALATVVLAVFIRTFVFQSFKIPSESMLPTLQIGDHILVNKYLYGHSLPVVESRLWQHQSPQVGDVIVFEPEHSVFKHPSVEHADYFIKRVMGTPGDTVEVKNFRAYVNDINVDEELKLITAFDAEVIEANHGNFGPLTLEEGEYFVLGDNRLNSKDSRYFGPIKERDIKGRAFVIYWSWARNEGSIDVSWRRIGRKIH